MKHLLFIPLILFSLSLAAQDHPIQHAKYEQDVFQRFDNFTMKNGLPSNTIRKIFQDKNGFIWLATDNGLSRYDGSKFINFLPKDGDSLSLSNREVTSIAQTKDGYLWIGTKDGLNRLNPQTGKFRQYRVGSSPFVSHNYVRALLVDSHGFLWIAYANGTVTKLNTATYRYSSFHSTGNSWADYWQHFIFEKKDGNIWFGGYGFPLREYSYKTNETTLIPDTLITVHGRLSCMAAAYQDKNGSIWLANVASWGLIYNPSTKRYTELPKLGGLNAIAADSKGNIWLGGYWPWLCRYNPANNTVTQFEHNSSIPHSRIGQQTFSILCDRSGVVWIGTDAGLSRYSPYKNKFALYRHIPDEAASPISNNIITIFQDSDGDLWFGTNDAGIFSHNLITNHLHHYKYEPNNPNTISSATITGIGQDNQGNLWFSLWDGSGSALNSLNKTTGKVKRHKTCEDYYWYNDIEIQNDTILVGSWGTGLEYYDKRKNDYYEIIRNGSKGFKRDMNGIYYITADGAGNLWFSSFMAFNSYSVRDKKFTGYFINSSHFNKASRLIAQRFKAKKLNLAIETGSEHYFRDSRGVVWNVGESGLVELNKKENRFKSYAISGKAKPSTISNSYKGNGFWLGGDNGLIYFSFTSNTSVEYKPNIPLGSIATTAEISENRLVVGSSAGLYIGAVQQGNRAIQFLKISLIPFSTSSKLSNGDLMLGSSMGLYLLNSSNSSLVKVTGEGSGNMVHAMHTLNGRDIFIGTNNGLMHYKQGMGIAKWWKPNAYDRNQLIDEQVYSVTQTPEGTVWLATNRGYAKLNADNLTFTHFDNEAKDALTSHLVSRVFTDSRGNTWVGTTDSNGLNRIDGKTGVIDNYWNFLYDSTSITKGTINDIFEAHDGAIWIATDSGLCQHLPKTNNFRRYDERKGLGSSTIYAIQEDSRGNLWVSTQAGISRFNPRTLRCTNYTWRDGLQEGAFSRKCATKLKDGRLVFGGNEGYNMFYPDSIRSNPTPPLPMITSVSVNGKVRYISSPKKLNLSFAERNIEISFSCSDYNFPENNQLAYKLEGFDQEFKQAATGQAAVYTNLPPGSYRFILQATNNDGKWGKSSLILSVRIGYPIWLQWWAILLEVSAILGLVYLIMKFHLMNITKQKQSLEKEVTLRTEQLLLKNEEIATHHDVLANQKEHIQKLYNQLSDSIEYAEIIQHSNLLTTIQRDNILGRNFLISLPKEKLSGDFFWAQRHNNKAIFVVADCMLHGVPGAVLGMVGISHIKEISLSAAYSSPDETLNALHQRIKEFSTGYDQYKHLLNNIQIGYCMLDRSRMKISFSGKQIDLYISRRVNGVREIIVCLGNQQWLQDSSNNNELYLVEHAVMPGDYLYMFSDGLTKQLDISNSEDFNKQQLKKIIEYVAEYPFEMHEALILEKIDRWKEASDQIDDITFIGVNV